MIPHNTIIKPPSAELREGQTDQDTLPEYDVLDGILHAYIEQDYSIAEIVVSVMIKRWFNAWFAWWTARSISADRRQSSCG